MEKISLINTLQNLADNLDQCGQYKHSEDVDNLIKIALLHGVGPKFRYYHPLMKDIKAVIGKKPPKNIIEKLYQEFAGYGTPLTTSKTIRSSTSVLEEFFDDILHDYEKDQTISMDFVELMTTSHNFIEGLKVYLKIDSINLNTKYYKQPQHSYSTEQKPEIFKKMLQETEQYLIQDLEREFKKFKKTFEYKPKTDLVKVIPKLLEIKELLPSQFLALVMAINEWMEYQRNAEVEMANNQNMFKEHWKSAPNAREELEQYLKDEPEEEKLSVFSKYTINTLYKIATSLEKDKLYKEASHVKTIMKRIAA